ncbi:hypothetical protein [Clostridium sp.]|uniref:hypothetical protein n=1 Tax=Clostridium sp. TaxID=1506 RepID=UPI0025B89ABD|nr:hypothetical protein [Clostridium sp.]
MNDKIGKALLVLASTSVIVLIIISSIKLLDSIIYRDVNQPNIEYYENYYIATETLLDSLGVDCDNSIFETDAGAEYLMHKYNVDSVFHSK